MTPKILFALSFFLGLQSVFAQTLPDSVSLEEALAFGEQNNRTIQNANLEVQKAYKDKWSTIAIGLPQISANANYQNFIELPTSLIPAQFFGGNEGDFAEVQFGTPQTMDAGVTVQQLIFDGSYLVGLEASRIFLAISENILEKTLLEIRKNIVNTYSSVLLARENIQFLENNHKNLKNTLEELNQLFRNGFEEEESVEQLRLTLSGVETQLRYAKNLERITLNMLKLLIGFPTQSPLLLSDTLEKLTDASLFSLQISKDISLSNNVDIKMAENNLLSETLLYKYERSKSLPRLSAFLNGNYTGNSETFSFTQSNQKWFGAALFGINLQVPIFSSLQRSANSQKAKIAVSQAEKSLTETQERITIEVQAAENEYQLAVENYFTSKENLALAKRIEEKNQTKYFEGVASSFELREAQLQLYSAQNNYIKAIQNVIQKKLALETLLNTPQQ
ncbi:TolC family protein [Flavobacteriaceae bacterium]|jgi:outer membrane protein TolC|nr:TolC family protein [Flavobacteriaceae bacterium]MDC0916793.1 TolC family protein [Flavobacteriaceae bacterium]MDC3329548.1 TolC family protein [Flavobacteriaceae bacterium]